MGRTNISVNGKLLRTPYTMPLGPRIRKLLGAALADEAQEAKNKLTLRGAALRGLRPNGRSLLTGTWMKGYITDLFWTAGWVFGFGTALWPFPYNGGSARFLEQFGTYKYVTKEFADSLSVGQRKLIPSVSNLNRLWRYTAPSTIRRVKEDFLKDLPKKHRHHHWLEAEGRHRSLVNEVEAEAHDVIADELRKDEKANLGRIGAALWWTRYAASCPTIEGCAHYGGAYGAHINVTEASVGEIKQVQQTLLTQGKVVVKQDRYTLNKVAKALEIVQAAKAAGEKVLVFTSLRGMYALLGDAFDVHGIKWLGVQGTTTRNRRKVVDAFEEGSATVLLSGTGMLNRGVTIVAANHVVICNEEWSPEVTLQAEDRVHRPGQEREVHVHRLFTMESIDADMWELNLQKWAAQRAVQDREAQFQTVEDIMRAAANANAQLAVARSVARRVAKSKTEANATLAGAPVEITFVPASTREVDDSVRDTVMADVLAMFTDGKAPPPPADEVVSEDVAIPVEIAEQEAVVADTPTENPNRLVFGQGTMPSKPEKKERRWAKPQVQAEADFVQAAMF